jgi:hypothetical protein
MSQDAMSWNRSAMGTGCLQQFATMQPDQCGLDRAFGKSRFVGNHAQACFDRLPALTRRAAKERQINEERGRVLIVSDDIAHEHIEDIIVNWHGLPETGHIRLLGYTDNRTRLFAVGGGSSLDGDEPSVLPSQHD